MRQLRNDPLAAPRRRPFLAALLPCAAAAALAAAGSGRVQEPGNPEDTRAILGTWLETERLILAERRDWKLKRELLAEQIALADAQIESMRGSIADAEAALAAAGGERSGLEAELAALDADAAAYAADVAALEERTRALVARLPEAAVERVRSLLPRIPADPATTKEAVGSRYLTVVGILNSINKFNREITLTSEVRRMADGAAVEVSVLYAGVSQAWYLSSDLRYAGIGTAGPDGWLWIPADERAADIARAFAVHSGAEPAAFVGLPLESR